MGVAVVKNDDARQGPGNRFEGERGTHGVVHHTLGLVLATMLAPVVKL